MKYAVYLKDNCSDCDTVIAALNNAQIKYVRFTLWVGQPRKRGVRYFKMSQLRYLIPKANTLPQVFNSFGEPVPINTLLPNIPQNTPTIPPQEA